MSHTEKASLYLAESSKALALSKTTTAGMRKEWLVIASNYANLASQELAVEHSVVCLPE